MISAKQELIRYRLSRAREAISDAESDLKEGRLNSASNRIYYAMFYGAITLLAERNLSSARHSGIIALFYEHLVRPGVFPPVLAQYLGQAFEMRTTADYRDFSIPDAARLSEMLVNARLFVHKVEELIQTPPPRPETSDRN